MKIKLIILLFTIVLIGCSKTDNYKVLQKWSTVFEGKEYLQFIVWTSSTDSLNLLDFSKKMELQLSDNPNARIVGIAVCHDSLDAPRLTENGAIENVNRAFASYALHEKEELEIRIFKKE